MRGICFQIKDILVETTLQKCLEDMGEVPYAIVLSPSTWMKHRDSFDMGFDIDPNPENIYNTKAEVNYDSIKEHSPFPTGRIWEERTLFFLLPWMKRVSFLLTGAVWQRS